MRSSNLGSVGAAALITAVACSAVVLAQQPAQDPAPPPPPSTVGQIRSGVPQPTFRAGVTLVTTDVIVRDRNGIFLPDLVKDDFRVLEDGVEQEIASLVLVHGGRVYNQFLPPPPVQEGIILPASRPPNDTAGRIFILFVDDLHLTSTMTPKVRQIFKQISDTLVHEGDLFGIISTGPSSISIDMTYDRNRLDDAMGRITGDALSIRDQIEIQDTSRGPAEVLHRAHVSFKTAREVLGNLEEVTNRRKVFIYLSNGYDFNPFPESRMFNGFGNASRRDGLARLNGGQISQAEFDQLYSDFPDPLTDPFAVLQRQGQQFADADLSTQLAELARVANRANTSFYTFDPRGLVAGPDINETIPIEEWQTHIFKTQNSLRMLSELTGGMAVVNRNDYGNALRQIDAETSDYYIVGFYTSNPDPTFRTRRLSVEIVGQEDEDLDIRSRTHYTLPRGPA
jgi:VWFA-related protein